MKSRIHLKTSEGMICEACGKRVHSMVSLPKKRHKDGTIICFKNLCLNCAKIERRKTEEKYASKSK